MDNNTLIVGSLVALIVRVLAVIILGVVLFKQFKIFSRANVYESEAKLKILLFHMTLFALLSNFPIMFLNYERFKGITGSNIITVISTIFNAFSILVIGIILFIIYSSKDGQDGY